MQKRHVTIGPEFFQKAKSDYADWRWSLIREFFQNCFDSHSSVVTADITKSGNNTILTVTNNGHPMSEDILIDKLFALGASGKNFQEGSVGGFGKAKELLYMAHLSYEIWSGKQHIKGSGADYEHNNNSEFFDGTRSTILIEGDHVENLLAQTGKFCQYAQFRGEVFVNGELIPTSLNKGARRRDFDFGTVYTNKSFQNRLIVRIGGVPMFTRWISVDRCVVVELSGISSEVLTSNRDGLIEPYCGVLDSFTTELAVDKRSALKSKQPKYARFAGDRLSHVSVKQETQIFSIRAIVEDRNTPDVEGIDIGEDEKINSPSFYERGQERDPSHYVAAAFAEAPQVVATLGQEFIIKNETDLVIPKYYRPDTGDFSTYSQKLIRMWGRTILELHRMYDFESTFAIGFIFDDSTAAEYEDGIFGKVFYLNPANIVEQSSSFSKSFSKRYKLTDRNTILAIAVHEFIHALGFGQHDEIYSGKLTDVMAQVLDERKRFNWCFR